MDINAIADKILDDHVDSFRESAAKLVTDFMKDLFMQRGFSVTQPREVARCLCWITKHRPTSGDVEKSYDMFRDHLEGQYAKAIEKQIRKAIGSEMP